MNLVHLRPPPPYNYPPAPGIASGQHRPGVGGTFGKAREAERHDIHGRRLAIGHQFRQQLAQRRRMHGAVPRRTVRHEEVVALGGRAKHRMMVGGNFIEPAPRSTGVEQRASQRGEALAYQRGRLLDPRWFDRGIPGTAPDSGRWPHDEQPVILLPAEEAVADELREWKIRWQRLPRWNTQHLAAKRQHRQRHTGSVGERRGPGTGGIDHGANPHRTEGGYGRGDAPGTAALESLHLCSPEHAHTLPSGGGQVSGERLHGAEYTVRGRER